MSFKKEKTSSAIRVRSSEMARVGNLAVHEAQKENHRLGLPNVFSRRGKIFYELPNGEITSQEPT